MKARAFLIIPLTLVAAALVVISFYFSSGARAVDLVEPTPATAWKGDDGLNTGYGPTSVPLAQPLEMREQVLKQVLYYDATWAEWEQPWFIDTLAIEPDRIVVTMYPNRSAESADFGVDEWYSPETEEDAGPVWSVSIKGRVQVAVLGGNPESIYDGVTYVVSSRTGNLLAIRTGSPLNR